MRAMPSPTSSTLPTSARSIWVRYVRISSSMTDAISSTLNLMKAPWAPLLRLGDVGLAALDLTRGARQQRLGHLVQARRQAGGDLPLLELDHHSGDQRWIDLLDQRRLAVDGGGDGVRQPGAQGVGERHGGADVDVHPAAQVPQRLSILRGDGAQGAEAPLAADHLERVDQQVARTPPEGLLDHLHVRALLDQRAGQELLEFRVAVEMAHQSGELLLQRFGLPLLLGDAQHHRGIEAAYLPFAFADARHG